MLPSASRCQACARSGLHEIEGYARLPRVTSDSKIFRAGGRLFVCAGCGMVQKIADAQWLTDIAEIYRDYDMYHQSAANDQAVFDPLTGQPAGRCELLTRRLSQSQLLGPSGTLLDVGSGSGAMLGAFSAACPGWRLFGLDLDDRKEAALRTIPRFETLYTVAPEQLEARFDLVSLVHSLEHFTQPLELLKTLRGRLSTQGRVFVQVNNVEKQMFDLVVADHLCHFSPRSLAFIAACAGLEVQLRRTDWVNKEISMLARAAPAAAASPEEIPEQIIGRIQSDVEWLDSLIEHARDAARDGPLAVFGTSVAATWLAGGLGERIECFVDEDPAREGRRHLDRPIVKPVEVPAGTSVYLAFVPEIAAAISQRLSHLPVKLVTPPSLAC